MATIGKDLSKAKLLLEAGKLVAIPTETVYGLAANGLNEDAVASIFAAKKRPAFDPLILHTNSLEKLRYFVESIPGQALKLAENFWPGPLTILFRKKPVVPDLTTSGLDTIAVRIPDHPLTLELLQSLDFPLAAPSANPFGYVSPTRPEHVEAQLGREVDYILDGGPCKIGVESTIISFEQEQPEVLRMGGLAIETLEELMGDLIVREHSSSSPQAPGMLKSHYAPGKSFVLIDSPEDFVLPGNDDFAVLAFDRYVDEVPRSKQFLLSPKGDVREAATRLFGTIRQLDQLDTISRIIAVKVPDKGLGRAINDRLKRAAAED